MPGHHIHIAGRVQGVGFRPFVYDLAHEFGLNGWVLNGNDGVRIYIHAELEIAQEFYDQIINRAPHLSIITYHEMTTTWSIPEKVSDFVIRESDSADEVNMLITPDFALCADCRSELNNPKNRRYNYPFITCTKCGPRYSIIGQLPYDRHRTAMATYKMCHDCKDEYGDIHDKRYYSQTNSCEACRISMTLWNSRKEKLTDDQDEIIDKVRLALFDRGKIVAIKGIGGYILMADATNADAIDRLRKRKKRSSKPFALMYPSIDVLKEDVSLNDNEIDELLSERCPIVLTQLLPAFASGLCGDVVAPGMGTLGVMLPYTGLYEMILNGIDKPVIATSGNVSNAPIIYTDEQALELLIHVTDLVVTNDREIYHPQDDSVLTFSPIRRQKIIIRRSRGLAPSFDHHFIELEKSHSILATGADLKATFSLFHRGEIYTSQYLGDLSHYDCELSFVQTLDHLQNMIAAHPNLTLIDSHPEYSSSGIGRSFAEENNLDLRSIQHHEAHFAAVLGENDLINTKEKVLGVIWDGTGFGTDNQIWGGEFFGYKNFEITRESHIEYYSHLAGDKMSCEPRISMLALLYDCEDFRSELKAKFSDHEWTLYSILLEKEEGLNTSSMGRVFDAAASLLGLVDINDFEGHAAMRLEQLARKYITNNGIPCGYKLQGLFTNNGIIKMNVLLKKMIRDVCSKLPPEFIAAKFHITLVDIIEEIAFRHGYRKIAFSGGVFQNALLIDLLWENLENRFQLYFHKELSPNDENISFGQIAHYSITQKRLSFVNQEELAFSQIN